MKAQAGKGIGLLNNFPYKLSEFFNMVLTGRRGFENEKT